MTNPVKSLFATYFITVPEYIGAHIWKTLWQTLFNQICTGGGVIVPIFEKYWQTLTGFTYVEVCRYFSNMGTNPVLKTSMEFVKYGLGLSNMGSYILRYRHEIRREYEFIPIYDKPPHIWQNPPRYDKPHPYMTNPIVNFFVRVTP